MINDVENEVEEQQAEDGLVNHISDLKQLSEDIDKATNTFINAALELESAIQQYQRAEAKLGGAEKRKERYHELDSLIHSDSFFKPY